MEKRLPVLQVQMFGKEKVTYGDKPILYGRGGITKSMKLLLILLYYGNEGIFIMRPRRYRAQERAARMFPYYFRIS